MRLDGGTHARATAKRLRQQMSPPEVALWLALRGNAAGVRFRRQHPAGRYVLDFYCAPALLAVEVDGQAHERGDRPARDAARDAWLRAQGVRVLRYRATDVLTETETVVRQIVAVASGRVAANRASLSAPSVVLRTPPPPGGGG